MNIERLSNENPTLSPDRAWTGLFTAFMAYASRRSLKFPNPMNLTIIESVEIDDEIRMVAVRPLLSQRPGYPYIMQVVVADDEGWDTHATAEAQWAGNTSDTSGLGQNLLVPVFIRASLSTGEIFHRNDKYFHAFLNQYGGYLEQPGEYYRSSPTPPDALI